MVKPEFVDKPSWKGNDIHYECLQYVGFHKRVNPEDAAHREDGALGFRMSHDR